MDDNERELVLRISVDADDIAPEVARLKAELAALDKATQTGADNSARAQDKATEATKKRKSATEDLGKSVTTQNANERKQLQDSIKLLEQHQKALGDYRKQLDEYQRRASEIEAANRVAEQRQRTGQVRSFAPQQLPPAPMRPAPPTGLVFQGGVAQVDQVAVNREATAIVDREQAQAKAVVDEVKRQRGSRQKPQLPAPERVEASQALQSSDREALLQQLGLGKPQERVKRDAQKVQASNAAVDAARQREVDAIASANQAEIARIQQRVEATREAAHSQELVQAQRVREILAQSKFSTGTLGRGRTVQSFDVLKLPEGQRLARPDYEAVRDEVKKIGGNYSTKLQGFAFEPSRAKFSGGYTASGSEKLKELLASPLPSVQAPAPVVQQIAGANSGEVRDYTGNAADPTLPLRQQILRAYDRLAAKKGADLYLSDLRTQFRDVETRKLNAELKKLVAETDGAEFGNRLASGLKGQGAMQVDKKYVSQLRIASLGGDQMLPENSRRPVLPTRSSFNDRALAQRETDEFVEYARKKIQYLYDKATAGRGAQSVVPRSLRNAVTNVGEVRGNEYDAAIEKMLQAGEIAYEGEGDKQRISFASTPPATAVRLPEQQKPKAIAPSAEERQRSLEERIREYYTQANKPEVTFADLREAIPDVSRDAINSELKRLARDKSSGFSLPAAPSRLPKRESQAAFSFDRNRRYSFRVTPQEEMQKRAAQDAEHKRLQIEAKREEVERQAYLATPQGQAETAAAAEEERRREEQSRKALEEVDKRKADRIRANLAALSKGKDSFQQDAKRQYDADPKYRPQPGLSPDQVLAEQRAYADRRQKATDDENQADKEELREYLKEYRTAKQKADQDDTEQEYVEPPYGMLGQYYIGREEVETDDSEQRRKNDPAFKKETRRRAALQRKSIADYEQRRAVASPPPAETPIPPEALPTREPTPPPRPEPAAAGEMIRDAKNGRLVDSREPGREYVRDYITKARGTQNQPDPSLPLRDQIRRAYDNLAERGQPFDLRALRDELSHVSKDMFDAEVKRLAKAGEVELRKTNTMFIGESPEDKARRADAVIKVREGAYTNKYDQLRVRGLGSDSMLDADQQRARFIARQGKDVNQQSMADQLKFEALAKDNADRRAIEEQKSQLRQQEAERRKAADQRMRETPAYKDQITQLLEQNRSAGTPSISMRDLRDKVRPKAGDDLERTVRDLLDDPNSGITASQEKLSRTSREFTARMRNGRNVIDRLNVAAGEIPATPQIPTPQIPATPVTPTPTRARNLDPAENAKQTELFIEYGKKRIREVYDELGGKGFISADDIKAKIADLRSVEFTRAIKELEAGEGFQANRRGKLATDLRFGDVAKVNPAAPARDAQAEQQRVQKMLDDAERERQVQRDAQAGTSGAPKAAAREISTGRLYGQGDPLPRNIDQAGLDDLMVKSQPDSFVGDYVTGRRAEPNAPAFKLPIDEQIRRYYDRTATKPGQVLNIADMGKAGEFEPGAGGNVTDELLRMRDAGKAELSEGRGAYFKKFVVPGLGGNSMLSDAQRAAIEVAKRGEHVNEQTLAAQLAGSAPPPPPIEPPPTPAPPPEEPEPEPTPVPVTPKRRGRKAAAAPPAPEPTPVPITAANDLSEEQIFSLRRAIRVGEGTVTGDRSHLDGLVDDQGKLTPQAFQRLSDKIGMAYKADLQYADYDADPTGAPLPTFNARPVREEFTKGLLRGPERSEAYFREQHELAKLDLDPEHIFDYKTPVEYPTPSHPDRTTTGKIAHYSDRGAYGVETATGLNYVYAKDLRPLGSTPEPEPVVAPPTPEPPAPPTRKRKQPAAKPTPEPSIAQRDAEHEAQRRAAAEEAVRAAYTRLSAGSDERAPFVSLRRMRDELGEKFSRPEVDTALSDLARSGSGNLVPESNQKTLTRADRDAALNFGDQDKHLLSIDREVGAPPVDTPQPEAVKAVAVTKAKTKRAVTRAQQRVQALEKALAQATQEALREADAQATVEPDTTPEPPEPAVPRRRTYGDDTPINFDADDISGPPEPPDFDALEAEQSRGEQLAIEGRPQRRAIGAAPRRPIPIERNRSGLDPFAQDPRRKQSRDRQNLIRKDRRKQALLERQRKAAEQKALRDSASRMLDAVHEFGPDDDPYAFEEPDYRGRIDERQNGESLDEFMDRLDEERGRYLPKEPRKRRPRAKQIESGRARRPLQIGTRPARTFATPYEQPRLGPVVRPGGDAREADEAADQIYENFHGIEPRVAGPEVAEPAKPKRRSGAKEKIKVEVDCEHLDHSITECLKRKRFHIDIDGNVVGGSGSGGGANTGQTGPNAGSGLVGSYAANTGDPVADAKQNRANKAAEDAEAARLRKEAQANANQAAGAQAGDNRFYNVINRVFEAQAKASKAEHEAARADQTGYNRDFAKDRAESYSATRTVREEAVSFATDIARERAAAASANAARSRESAAAAKVRREETERRAQRDRKRDDAADRKKEAPPVGIFNSIKGLFADVFRDYSAFRNERVRNPDRDTISPATRTFRSLIAATNNKIPSPREIFDPSVFFKRAFGAGAARQSSTNAAGEVKQSFDEGIFKRLRSGVKTVFDQSVIGGFRKEFSRLGKDAEGIFSAMKRGFKGAFSDVDGGKGNAFTNFLGSAGKSVDKFSQGVLNSFGGLDIRLLSFRTLIAAAIVALGPLVAMLGSVAGGALALANGFAQIVSSAAALPGLLFAAATAVGALITAFKPLEGILSAYSAKQDAVATATASGVPVSRAATRAQQDLNKARRDAKRDLEDLNTALSRIKLNENGAILNVKQARQNYLETLADPNASLLDQQVAYQGLQQAKADQSDLKTKDKRLVEDSTPASKKKYGDADTRTVEDATSAVATGGGSAVTTASAKLNAELKKAGPETKKFALGLAAIFLDKDGPWKKVQKTVAEKLFTPLVGELGNIKSLLGPVSNLLGTAATALGNLAKRGIDMLSSGPWTKFFSDQAEANVGLIDSLGDAGLSVADAFRNITEAARPFTQFVADAIKGLAADFDDWATKGNKSGGIRDFLMKQVKPTLEQVATIVGNLFLAFKNLFSGSNDFTRDFFTSLVNVTTTFYEWSKSAADPNSGFRKFLRDTMPLLKQVGGFLLDIVQAFFAIASDPRNIKEAQKILTVLSDKVLPAIVDFFTELSSTGVVSKVASVFGDVAIAINKIIQNGGGTAFAIFVTALQGVVKFFTKLVGIPGVSTILGVMAIGLAGLAAASAVIKFTGLGSLFKFLKFLVENKGSLSSILGTISSKLFGGKTNKIDAASSAGGAGAASPETTVLERISGQMATAIGLLERIAACVCAEKPCTCGAAGAAGSETGATQLTVAGEQLIVAARELIVAATLLKIGGVGGALPIASKIPRAITGPGAKVIEGEIVEDGAKVAAAKATKVVTSGAEDVAGKRAANEVGNAARSGGFFSNVASKIKSFLPFGGSATAAGAEDVAAAAGRGGAAKIFSKLASGARALDPLLIPGLALGTFADLKYRTPEQRKSAPAQFARAGGAALTAAGIGAQIAGPYGAIAGAIAGGVYSEVKDPGLRKTTKKYLDSDLGSFLSPGASVVSKVIGGFSKDDKGKSGFEKTWDGAYEGFMKKVGSPVADFFRHGIPDAGKAVGTFFTQTIPNWIADHLTKPIVNFFTKTLPSLPGKVLDAISFAVGYLFQSMLEFPGQIQKAFRSGRKFFDDNIGKPIRNFIFSIPGFFTDTIPKWYRSGRKWFEEHIGKPVRNFVFGIPGFFTETIPKWYTSGRAWFNTHIGTPIRDFVFGIPDFFTKTIPRWFDAAPAFIHKHIIDPLTNFFGTTLPNFFTKTLPDAIASIPGFIYNNVIQPVIDFFSAIPGAVSSFFSGTIDAITDLASGIFGRVSKFFNAGRDARKAQDSPGKQSGGLIEGTYDGRVDTKLVPLTIGEFVNRKRVVDKPYGKQLFNDLNEERLDPAMFYAALGDSSKLAQLSVSMPAMRLSEPSSTTTTVTNTTTTNKGGTSFGDVHIHNPIREKSETSMRRSLHKLAYMSER